MIEFYVLIAAMVLVILVLLFLLWRDGKRRP